MHLLIEVFPGSLGIKEQTLIAQPVLTGLRYEYSTIALVVHVGDQLTCTSVFVHAMARV